MTTPANDDPVLSSIDELMARNPLKLRRERAERDAVVAEMRSRRALIEQRLREGKTAPRQKRTKGEKAAVESE